MIIRTAEEKDAQALIDLFVRLDHETEFMLLEPAERNTDVEQQRQRIMSFRTDPAELMAVAEVENMLVGFIVAQAGKVNRNRHCAHLVIGVERTHWGKGLGTQLMDYMESWAVDHQLQRLELTVMEHNHAARSFYQKSGYQEEGIRRSAVKIKGSLCNEIYMSKLL